MSDYPHAPDLGPLFATPKPPKFAGIVERGVCK